MIVTVPSGPPLPDASLPSERSTHPDDLLLAHVHKTVSGLQAAYLADSATGVAALAKLRRAVHASPGSDPTVWFETLDGVPAALLGRTEAPSPYETAIHASVTLYAIHQQSQRGRMHQLGHPLGRSIRLLTRRIGSEVPGNDSPVMRRFHALGTATSLPETMHHLRGLVTQLRGQDLPVDYGLLARDLRRLQDQRTAPGVRLQWGRDFHRMKVDAPEANQMPEQSDDTRQSDLSTGDPK